MAKYDYTKLAKQKKFTEKEMNALKNYMNKIDIRDAQKLNDLVANKDGTKLGFDLELTKKISNTVNIPVIASGGVGNIQHLIDGIKTMILLIKNL